jgi:predicted chitinase
MFNMPNLLTITDPVPLDTLAAQQLTEMQIGLSALGYPIAQVDGMYGPNTRNAWAEFKTDLSPGNPALVGPDSVKLLASKAADIANNMAVAVTDTQSVKNAIIQQCKLAGLTLKTQMAYVLATTQWETAQTFKPVKEAYWLSEQWRQTNLKYFPYYGRGYVQLTWKTNYLKYGGILTLDLVNNPDLALGHPVALFVLVHGFQTGGFTGRKLTDYITSQTTDFVNARRCINGTDHAQDIANVAQLYMNTL